MSNTTTTTHGAVTVGHGVVVHMAYGFDGPPSWTLCGAGNSVRAYGLRQTNKTVTCKRCLKRLAADVEQAHAEALEIDAKRGAQAEYCSAEHERAMIDEHRTKFHSADGTCSAYGAECAVPEPQELKDGLAVWLVPGLVLTPPDGSGRVFRFVEWRRGGAYVRNVATGQGRLVAQSEVVLWKHLPEQNADDVEQPEEAHTLYVRHRNDTGDTKWRFEGTERVMGETFVWVSNRVGGLQRLTLTGFTHMWRACCEHGNVAGSGCILGSCADEAGCPEMAGPRYPEGTPEYARYAAKLREELRKFSAGEPPYDTWDQAMKEHTAAMSAAPEYVTVLLEQRDAAERDLSALRTKIAYLSGRWSVTLDRNPPSWYADELTAALKESR